MPSSTQFDITGFIQEATLDTACSTDAHCGGVLKVEGHTIVVPKETIVVFPANAITYQEMFSQAPAPYGLAAVQGGGAMGATGLALNDLPTPLGNYEAHVIGNRVLGGAGGPDIYIAGLIYISQQGLNSGQGFINCISYANPAATEIRVGGPLGNCAAGARIRINDPTVGLTGTGRYG